MTSKERKDAYQRVTEQILAALDRGVVPWKKPWHSSFNGPTSMSTGRRYTGINTFILAIEGRESKWWGTYKQIKKHGGQVMKGEHGTVVVFWKFLPAKDENGKPKLDDAGRPKMIPLLRFYNVFNAEQAEWPDGLPERFQPPPEIDTGIEPLDALKTMLADYVDGPTVKRQGDRACYRPSTDEVNVPVSKHFDRAEAEFGTMAHELVHSTGHKSRLKRLDDGWVGREEYAKEELVAEMGAAFLAALYGVKDDEQMEQSASYIDGWRKAINDDPKLVVHAAGKAKAAVERIAGVAEAEDEDDSEQEVAEAA